MANHLDEWRHRRHIVTEMPFGRLAGYLRFESSRALALVDAIICWASSGIVLDGTGMGSSFPFEKALRLATDVRELPENCAMHDGRKWKQIPFIIFPGLAGIPQFYYLPVPDTVVILDLTCASSPGYALSRIQKCVDDYQDNVLRDYRSAGFLIRAEKGHIQIGPALTPRDPEAEGAYYLGRADRREHRGWVTLKRDREGLSADVETFRYMLERNASEREMHKFFKEHPAILMEATERIPLSHRPNFVDPKRHTPDYALSPLLGPIGTDNSVGLMELKGPGDKLLTKGLHAGFASKVHRAVDQVRDYDRYLIDPSNREAIKRSLGYIPSESTLAVLIGREPRRGAEAERLNQRRAEIDVKIVTYDEILQKQADQIGLRYY